MGDALTRRFDGSHKSESVRRSWPTNRGKAIRSGARCYGNDGTQHRRQSSFVTTHPGRTAANQDERYT